MVFKGPRRDGTEQKGAAAAGGGGVGKEGGAQSRHGTAWSRRCHVVVAQDCQGGA